MRKNETFYSIILLLSAAATELHSTLAAIFPELKKGIKRDLFWSPTFKMEIDLLWYIKIIFDNLFLVTILFIAASVTYYVSKKMFYVFSIFLLYNIIDFFSFCWNFKQTEGMYWIFLIFVFIAILMVIFKRNNMRAV